ncbi:hypothetical protein [Lacticaseibacillus songhuajiangensis]|uniref:hypothetical protein n=1 Tax=Lacticaseibacillus songhuajiangensis TaxID=1296539 RepID=UPI000F78E9AC|nr:hypothetical protein [Lacticaseibacillus songhuajiangensis]
MQEQDTEALTDLIDRVEKVQQLMGMHAEQAVDLNNAVIEYRRSILASPNTDATARLVAAASVNGARMEALGNAALTQLAEIYERLAEQFTDDTQNNEKKPN